MTCNSQQSSPLRTRAQVRVCLLLRLVVGVVFLFSGAVKGVDPYGTALKIGEYLHVMGIEWLAPLSGAMSVALVGVEVALGVALVAGAWPRLTASVTLAFNAFYTLLTLWLAVANPISDCGCFGDVVVLTNQQTFWKNVALLAMSVPLWVLWRGSGSRCGRWVSVVVTVAAVGFTAAQLLWLPVVEKFPFGEGVDLRALVLEGEQQTVGGKIVCRNLATGEVVKFDVEDPAWWDDSVWEYVDTEQVGNPNGDRVQVTGRDFVLTDAQGDMTADVVEYEGVTELVCLALTEKLSQRKAERVKNVVAESLAQGKRVVVATASELESAVVWLATAGVDVANVEVCNMDITTLQVVVRAPQGVVRIDDGVIVSKRRL